MIVIRPSLVLPLLLLKQLLQVLNLLLRDCHARVETPLRLLVLLLQLEYLLLLLLASPLYRSRLSLTLASSPSTARSCPPAPRRAPSRFRARTPAARPSPSCRRCHRRTAWRCPACSWTHRRHSLSLQGGGVRRGPADGLEGDGIRAAVAHAGARPGATSPALVDATMNARDITDRVAARRCEWAGFAKISGRISWLTAMLTARNRRQGSFEEPPRHLHPRSRVVTRAYPRRRNDLSHDRDVPRGADDRGTAIPSRRPRGPPRRCCPAPTAISRSRVAARSAPAFTEARRVRGAALRARASKGDRVSIGDMKKASWPRAWTPARASSEPISRPSTPSSPTIRRP